MKAVIYACTGVEVIHYIAQSIVHSVDIISTEQLLKDSGIVAFSDSAPELWGTTYLGLPVVQPSELKNMGLDKIYISSAMSYAVIQRDLVEKYGISLEKITYEQIWHANLNRVNFVKYIASSRLNAGSVAECGVFRGDFAKTINTYFPNSTLHLFDTFEGFSSKDLDSDNAYKQSSNKHLHLADTSVDIVLSKMLHPELVKIHKGYFPETASNVSDRFTFVNLDFDLYAPTKAGLEFFFPKMISGGVILIHDYFNSNFDCKRAVDEFCSKIGAYAMPIGDVLSVAILI